MKCLAYSMLFSLCSLFTPSLYADTPPTNSALPTDKYQRYIIIHNDYGFPIYPLIQTPESGKPLAQDCPGNSDKLPGKQ
jgi:hypothetical protein